MKADYINTLILAVLSVCILIIAVNIDEPKEIPTGYTPLDMYADIPHLTPTPTPEPIYPEVIDEAREIRRKLGELTITKRRLVLGNEYRMYITAYCSAECGGSVTTSSGARVHRSQDPYEPTTCAIDRRYFKYGDLFYVPSEDRVYIAEDTGSAVRGMHLDLFQDSMSDVRGYNTRYETCYRCEYEDYEVMLSNYDIREQIAGGIA